MSISSYLQQKWNTLELTPLLGQRNSENNFKLLDAVIPESMRTTHDSIRIVFDEMVDAGKNLPWSNRAGEFFPLEDPTNNVKDLIPQPVMPSWTLRADKLKDLENYYKAQNTNYIDQFLASRFQEMIWGINKTAQSMIAEFLKNSGKIYFRTVLPRGGFYAADFTYPGTFTNLSNPSVSWDNSSKTLGQIYTDITDSVDAWELARGIDLGENFTIFCKPQVFKVIVNLATQATNTSDFRITVRRNSLDLNEYRFVSIRGKYIQYSGTPSAVDFLEDNKIYFMADGAPRMLKYCLQDNLNVTSAQPVYLMTMQDDYKTTLAAESKPTPVLSPNGFADQTVIFT